MKRCFAVMAGIVFCLVLIIPVSAESSGKEGDSRVIRVGSFPYSGFIDKDSGGEYSGYAYDYLQEISLYTGWKYEFIDTTWQESLEMLEKGEIDLLGAVIKSSKREDVFDFSDSSMINTYGILATMLDNETLAYEDFSAFKKLRIGAMEGNQQTVNFAIYSREHQFTPNLTYYRSEEELLAALKSGEQDAVILTSVLRSQELRVVAKFGENESFFATSKGNHEILDELNRAMGEIHFNDPYYSSKLYQKYFDTQAVTPISFSREELNYIKNAPPLKCLYFSSARPVSYYNEKTGAPSGIALDVLKQAEEKTGLTFELIPVTSLSEASKVLSEHSADLFLTKVQDFDWARKNSLMLTNSYLGTQTVMVTSGHIADAPVVALCDVLVPEDQYKDVKSQASQVKYYNDMFECLEAVRKGDADVTYVNSMIMSYTSGNPRYSHLQTIPMYGSSNHICIALDGQDNALLVSILNKGLESISETQLNQFIFANQKTEQYGFLVNLIYARPLQAVLFVGLLLSMIVLTLLLMFRSRAKNAREMKRMLYTDNLTGYPNYKALTEEAGTQLAKQSEQYALIYMDMHRFKAVNDAFGYDSGDRLLIGISDLLHMFMDSEEWFARIYADKFVLLLKFTQEKDFNLRLDRLSKQLNQLSVGEFENVNFLFSGGIYHLQKDSLNLDMAFDRANYAKNTVKDLYTNTFVYYDDVMRSQILEEKFLESSMQPALDNGEFVPFYQPKVNVVTNEVVGAEALLRWQHPKRGFIMPGDFLPFYERNGFILQIDFLIFEAVCRDIRGWLDKGVEMVPVSVNFSRRHMQNKQFVEKLLAIMEQYHVPTHLLEIEITETVALESIETAVEFANTLKRAGFLLSIDDYGTGYSSISFLQNLPLDVLKLDKTFIESAMQTQKAKDLMKYLSIAMRNNGIWVLCEGIENEAQKEFIVSLGCCFAQGYLYSKALPKDQYERFLNEHGKAILTYAEFKEESLGQA